jgi:predicted ATPase
MHFTSLSTTRLENAAVSAKCAGSNIASVIGYLARHDKTRKALIEEYLAHVAPAVHGVEPKVFGHLESLEFRQEVSGSNHPWRFLAASMSDGTLRALGIPVALFQGGNGRQIPLVAIEEPEVALHPAAAGVLLDALRQASEERQIIVTSHSPELLDHDGIRAEEILAVVALENVTRIGAIDEASRRALMERLYTPGELLRLDQLAPDGQCGVARWTSWIGQQYPRTRRS